MNEFSMSFNHRNAGDSTSLTPNDNGLANVKYVKTNRSFWFQSKQKQHLFIHRITIQPELNEAGDSVSRDHGNVNVG